MLYSGIVIDWYSVLFNAFWILGLAVIVAAFSYHHWEARQNQRRLKEQLNQPDFLRMFWFGFILICMGLAGTSEQLWEMVVWGIFTVIGIINVIRNWVVTQSPNN
jgi:hypothetical protein